MSLTVSFIDVTTRGTSPRRIARVNRGHYHAVQSGLVLDKAAKLGERPTVQDRSLAASGSYPFTNVRQILQRNPASGVVRGLYDLLRDDVIHVSGKALFFAGKNFQFALGRTRLFGLQFATQLAVTVAHTLHALSLVKRAVTGYGDIGDSKVNPKKTFGVNLWRFVNVARLEQVELAIAVDEIAFAVQPFEQLGLALTADKRHFLPSGHCPDGHDTFGEFVGDKAVVERESSQGLECALAFLGGLIPQDFF